MIRESFVERFGIVLTDEEYFEALRQLGIPRRKRTADYSEVAQAINVENCAVLVFSEIDLSPDSTAPNKHCSVLLRIDCDGFCVWTPRRDGGEERINLRRNDWEAKQCSGAILKSVEEHPA